MKKIISSITIIFIVIGISQLLSCEKNFDTLKIISSTPANGSIGITQDFYSEVEFNNAVNRTDIEENFIITGSDNITGSFLWLTDRRFRFIPGDPVTKAGRYVMELPRSVRDKDGNTMDSDFISEFYIGTDFTPPSVVSSDPPFTVGAAENITVTSDIVINFSKSMNRESVEKAFSITPDVSGFFVWSENIPGVSYSKLTYRLVTEMVYGKLYTFTVGGSAYDISGNPLGTDYTVNFITGNDFTPPSVTRIYDPDFIPDPPDSIVYWDTSGVNENVSKNVRIAIQFSETMDRTSVENSFIITPSVAGNFEWIDDSNLIFKPSSQLESEKNYQIYIDTGAKNINGLKLSSAYSVEIKTNNSDSLYVKCGNIWGAYDGSFTGTPLSIGIPVYSTWPLIIVMDQVAPYSQDYYIKIEFVSLISPYTSVSMNKYSVINNVRIETFKSGPGGIDISNASIVDINWENEYTVIFKLNPLTNKLIYEDGEYQTPALYRITIFGGESGIKDEKGNGAEADMVFDFREAL